MKLPKVSHAFLTFTSILTCNVGWADVSPEIWVSPTNLSATLEPDESVTQQITISNIGGSDLLWQIFESAGDCSSPSDVPWLAVSPSAGTTPPGAASAIDVISDATGLTPGDYTGYLCVENNADVLPTIPVTLTVVSLNEPPTCDEASPSTMVIWPPNHKFVDVQVLGVSDPDGDPITITIDSIYQDEEVDERGDGKFAPDGSGIGTSTAEVRAERYGRGNGRVYHISFSAVDTRGGACTGTVMVSVPHDQSGAPAVDEGPLYDSTITP
jgi:hypothetical protein